MTDWKGWERYRPREPKVANKEEPKRDHMTAGWVIAVAIACLIGWATLTDGFDWTGQCVEPTAQLGC